MSSTIYNTTDGPLAIDRAGRMLAAHEHRDIESVAGSPLTGHIAAGRILVLDAPADDDTEHKPARKAGRTTSTTHEEA